MLSYKLLVLASAVALVAGHASLVMPPPRNAIDSELPPWHNTNQPAETDWIQPYNCKCTNGTELFCNRPASHGSEVDKTCAEVNFGKISTSSP